MNNKLNSLTTIVLISALAASSLLASDTERGLEIAREVDKRDSGFLNTNVDAEMVLMNKSGQQSIRYMTIKTLEVENDGDKSLVIFDRPRDVKGTAFLSFSHVEGNDDQWLFLPALKRVKRIASNNKSGPFMGSEFAYEDISSQEVDKYTYKYLKDEFIDGVDCYVVERYPTYENSGYTKQVAWIDKAEYRYQKVDFYDRKESLLKTLTYSGYKQYLEKFWRAQEMLMVNHQKGKKTLLKWKDYRFQTNLTDRDFDVNSLKRAR